MYLTQAVLEWGQLPPPSPPPQSWEESVSDRYREKLLELIGKIGRDDRQGKTASKILELLWSLAHLPQLSREMVELALESHSTVLLDSYHTKEAEKKFYINKCVEDIKKVCFHPLIPPVPSLHPQSQMFSTCSTPLSPPPPLSPILHPLISPPPPPPALTYLPLSPLQGQWVVSAFRQLHRFAKGFSRSGYGPKDQVSIRTCTVSKSLYGFVFFFCFADSATSVRAAASV